MHYTERNALDYSQLKKLIYNTDPTCMTYESKIAEVREQLNLSYGCEAITLKESRNLLRDIAEFRLSCIGPNLSGAW